MTKVSGFPDGYDVEEWLKSCNEIWHTGLYPNKKVPIEKYINGIKYRLFAWTELGDAPMIQKDMEIIKEHTKARHIASLKIGKKYQAIYIS
jgi:hypothetical protein